MPRLIARFDRFRHASGGTPTADLRLAMQQAMQEDVAVYRVGDTLQSGVDRVEKVRAGASDIKTVDRGLVWTHAYNHEEAIRCFKRALEHDPACAMATAKPKCISNCEVPASEMPRPPGIRLAMLISATIAISARTCAKPR